MKPPEVAEIHRSICESGQCEFLDRIDYTDPCAFCPNGHFGRHEQTGCKESAQDLSQRAPLKKRGPSMRAPGDVLAYVIWKVTGEMVGFCGACGDRVQKMNLWGWPGCMARKEEIIGWLIEEAGKRGHKITKRRVVSLLAAALKSRQQFKKKAKSRR